jgi:hypothetical protein
MTRPHNAGGGLHLVHDRVLPLRVELRALSEARFFLTKSNVKLRPNNDNQDLISHPSGNFDWSLHLQVFTPGISLRSTGIVVIVNYVPSCVVPSCVPKKETKLPRVSRFPSVLFLYYFF